MKLFWLHGFAGNFLFSFRPEGQDSSLQLKSSLSVEWSEELKGGKAVRLSGIFDKLSYEVRKALLFGPEKCFFSTTHCKLKSEGACVGSMHFLIQTIGREVPIMEPDNSGDGLKRRSVPIALQEQKEIILLPTVRVSNLLHLEIDMLLTENGKEAEPSLYYKFYDIQLPIPLFLCRSVHCQWL